MAEQLYTVIWDFKGGSYSSQIDAVSPESCFDMWLEIRRKNKENLLSAEDLIAFEREFDPDITTLVRLTGLKNVWSGDFSIREDYMSVTIVHTA